MLMEPRSKQGACCIPATVAIQATGDTSSLAFPHYPPPFRPPPFPRQETTLRPRSPSSSIPIPPRHDHKPISTRPVASASPACNSFLRWGCVWFVLPQRRLEPRWQCRALRRGRASRPSAVPGGAPISASSPAPPPYPPTSSAAPPPTPAEGLIVSGNHVAFDPAEASYISWNDLIPRLSSFRGRRSSYLRLSYQDCCLVLYCLSLKSCMPKILAYANIMFMSASRLPQFLIKKKFWLLEMPKWSLIVLKIFIVWFDSMEIN